MPRLGVSSLPLAADVLQRLRKHVGQRFEQLRRSELCWPRDRIKAEACFVNVAAVAVTGPLTPGCGDLQYAV
jgi:hypothetical protein